MPRGLTGRIVLAFAGIALAALLTIGGTLFFVLTRAYADDQQNTLVTVSIALASRSGTLAQGVVPRTTLFGPQSELLSQDVSIYVVRSGKLQLIEGDDTGVSLPSLPANPQLKTVRGTVQGNARYAYGGTVFGTTAKRDLGLDAVLVLAPDSSTSKALRSVATVMLVLIVVLAVIAIPAAWLLSRSITRPIGRLVHATGRVAGGARTDADGAGSDAPLPEEGPEEMRELTRHFNEMAAEIATSREQEAQLLAGLRHDLRTPLTSISGFAEAISDGTVTGEAAATAAKTIVDESHRLDRLVGELGVIERLREGPAALRPETLDAATLVASAAARFEPQAGQRELELTASSAPGLTFTADRLAVERILQNLVDNALRAAGAGGHVWVEAVAAQVPGRPPGVLLRVTDDGPGFPPGTIAHVFERFFRADPSRAGSGSGLGLAIVRELAQAHGGEAWAENVAPRGARVSVYLPRSAVEGNPQQ